MTLALGATFAVLTFFWACNPGRPWWRKRELVTDLCYWFFIPLFARYLRIGLLVSAPLCCSVSTGMVEFYEDGHGPLAAYRCGCRGIFLVGSDFLIIGRIAAFTAKLWKFHAVHHSSEDLDWISAGGSIRSTSSLVALAVDVVLLIAGISPNVLVFIGPFTTAHSAFVHANLNWTLGPFKYVLAGPVFHRWHHTAAERGGSKNFAATFPVLDLIFGTFYMPQKSFPTVWHRRPRLPAQLRRAAPLSFKTLRGGRNVRHLRFLHQFTLNSFLTVRRPLLAAIVA